MSSGPDPAPAPETEAEKAETEEVPTEDSAGTEAAPEGEQT